MQNNSNAQYNAITMHTTPVGMGQGNLIYVIDKQTDIWMNYLEMNSKGKS